MGYNSKKKEQRPRMWRLQGWDGVDPMLKKSQGQIKKKHKNEFTEQYVNYLLKNTS